MSEVAKYSTYKAFPAHEKNTFGNAENVSDDGKTLHNILNSYKESLGVKNEADFPSERRYHNDGKLQPNVVKIEVLSPDTRRRYLNGGLAEGMVTIQGEKDLCKQAMIDAMVDGEPWKPFYGITDQSDTAVAFSFTSTWGKPEGASMVNKIFGKAGGIAAKITGKAAGAVPSAAGTLLGLTGNPVLKFGGKLAKGTGKILGDAGTAIEKNLPNILSGAASIGKELASSVGANMSTAGACTLKEYAGSSFDTQKTITCKWYMPEQGNLARISIGRLIRMSYMRGIKDTLNATQVENICKYISTAGISATANAIHSNIKQGTGIVDNVVGMGSAVLDKAFDIGSSGVEGIAGAIGKSVFAGLNAFGYSMTIDPLPVRLTVGHILDIEPLVIKQVSITCSKEQFVAPDGSHIPLYVTAKIDFDMWMMPNPNVGFIQFMGDSLFRMDDYNALYLTNDK